MRDSAKQQGPSGISGILRMPQTDAPPINNACLPDIYNKLDADAIEKSRVVNRLLETRLIFQEKILNKYQCAAERFYNREKQRVKMELRHIAHRLPTMSHLPRLEIKARLQRLRKQQHPHNGYVTTPMEMHGLKTERKERPFCERYFVHHLPTKAKWYKKSMPPVDVACRLQHWKKVKGSIMVKPHVLHEDSKSEPIGDNNEDETEDDLKTI